jgi:hypothetical protein
MKMTAPVIAQLIIALGPTALELIPKLAATWTKEELTVEEILAMCAPAKKSYDQYLIEARTRLAALTPLHGT